MATIRDVARAAGVSTATVSRVFNGSTRVDGDTAARVWRAAADLDYWPNSAARSLTTSRSQALGVLLPDLHGEFFSEVIRGIDQVARQEKSQVLISSSHAEADELIAAARSMLGRIDGLIVMAPDEATFGAVATLAGRFPIVVMNPLRPLDCCATVSIASYEGARAAVEHLIGLGHRRIGIVCGPEGNVDAEERLRGHRDALRNAGLPVLPAMEAPGDFSEASGYRAGALLLGLEPPPSAVFAANDCMATGLMSALGDAGVAVPREMAIVGFDDIAIARYLNPPLTTVHVDLHELGRQAARLLLAAARPPRPEGPTHVTLPARLVLRQSCGRGRRGENPPGKEAAAHPRRSGGEIEP